MTEKDVLTDGKYRLRAPEPEDLDVLFGMENDTSLWMVSGNAVPYSRPALQLTEPRISSYGR